MNGREQFPAGLMDGNEMIELKSTYSGGDIEDSDGALENFKIFAGGKKVGFASVKSWSDGTALIERIDIDDGERCKGYGTIAIDLISCKFDRTFIVPDNKRAASLYSRIGRETDDDLWCSLDQGYGVYRV